MVHSDLLPAVREAIPDGVAVLCVKTPPEICETYGVRSSDATPPGCDEWESWIRRHEPLAQHSPAPRGSMFYTSGTTGRPKGVRRQPPSPETREAYADLRMAWFGHRSGMRTAMIGPMYHSVQSSYALAAVRAQGTAFLLPRFDAEQVLRLIHTERLTHLHLVPTMMKRLLDLPVEVRRQYDLASLEFVIHGAAPCPREIKRRMIEWWGPIIYEYYGTTEAGMISRSSSQEWIEREGTVGQPWQGRIVRIYDGDGKVLPPNTEGEIYTSLGLLPDFDYHNAQGARARIEREGLITNGDIGYLDEDGYLFLCDRKLDTIISGGVNIYPAEIEAALGTHPAVLDCAVFGIPDEEYGEAPAAAVQLRTDRPASADELRCFLLSRLANFKIPRRFEIRESLPRDDSGKIFKRFLRQPYWP